MSSALTLKIILPFLPPSELAEFEKYFPLGFLNAGLRDLIVCALENQEGEGYFVTACFNKIDEHLAALGERDYESIHGLFLTDRAFSDELKAMLGDFFERYNCVLRRVLGCVQFSFVRVLSYRVSQGIYVELVCEPFSKTPRR